MVKSEEVKNRILLRFARRAVSDEGVELKKKMGTHLGATRKARFAS